MTTAPSLENVRSSGPSPDITRAAQWLADQPGRPDNVRYLIQSRFGLTDADAAEAILLAGDFSVVRRAFG
jgi:hypothetical protein